MSESHGVDDLADQWLSDSGATAHIVSRKHLSSYRVLKEHPSLQCELKAANDGIIATYGIVDLEVRFFAQSPRGQKRVKSFVLTKCIIADIPFSVISPFSLKQHGWVTTLGDDRESKMSKAHISIKLEIRDRAWWAVAQLKRSTATTDVAPMDVSVAKAPACGFRHEHEHPQVRPWLQGPTCQPEEHTENYHVSVINFARIGLWGVDSKFR